MVICSMVYWKIANIHQRQTTATEKTLLDQFLAKKGQSRRLADIPFTDQDLSKAIESMDTFVDITKEDLKEIFAQAVKQSHNHQTKAVPCKEVMNPTILSVEYGTDLGETWQLFEQYDVHGIPVVDTFQRLMGIVTISDFVRYATQFYGSDKESKDVSSQIAKLCRKTPGFESDKPEVTGQIMSHPVIFAKEDDLVGNLIPLFSQHDIHHIPVVDDRRKLKGMLTYNNIMSANNN
jgi:CBS domain-containing membrane protein